jgi:hypothetical protein
MNDALQELQARVAQLEDQVSRLAAERRPRNAQPWWERIAGRFENDPIFDEIVQLGREYRQSQQPEDI